MTTSIRQRLSLALFFIVGGSIVFGGPPTVEGVWLTSPTLSAQAPATLPWLRPYHQGDIDFATGLYERTDQDMIVLGGDLPIVLQRTYRTQDEVSRAFGVGATHNGEWYLRGDGERFQWAELVLDSGTRVDYHRTTAGSSYVNARYEHTSSPSVFYKSRIGWTGRAWALRWLDGSVAIFRACSPSGIDPCSILELRNPRGLSIQYVRDSDPHATLRTIRSGNAAISLDYDEQRRIAGARGAAHQEVRYRYDEGGRLTSVTESSGVVRRYTYDTHGAMLTVDEPRWHITNAYDEGGRCIRNTTRWPDGETSTLDVTYQVRAGSIVEATQSRDGGPKTIYHFNDKHYLEAEERDPTGAAPIEIRYSRNALSQFAIGVSVRCYDADGRVVHKAEGEDGSEDATEALVEATCGAQPDR